MDLAELLQWLSQSQKTGTLVIDNGKVEKKLFLNDGRIVSSSSSDPKEYLGHFLVSQGLITENQLNFAIRQQATTKSLLGKILVSSGAVSENDLQRLLTLKAEEGIFDIFTWLNGEFRFLNDQVPEKNFIPLNLDLTGLLLEGARRVDEWNRIRKVIPDLASVPVSVADLNDPALSAGAAKILSLVNDDRTIEEIQETTHSASFFVCSVLFDQVQKKKMKIVRPRIIKVEVPVAAPAAARGPAHNQAPPVAAAAPSFQAQAAPPTGGLPPMGAPPSGGDPDQLDPAALLAAADGLIAQNDFERAMRYLRAARNVRPDDRSLEAAVKACEQKIRGAIERSGLALNRVPSLTVSLDKLTSLDVSAQEGFILTRIDGHYDFSSILKISPMPEIDALILFAKLHRAGHIKI